MSESNERKTDVELKVTDQRIIVRESMEGLDDSKTYDITEAICIRDALLQKIYDLSIDSSTWVCLLGINKVR